jgi:hypothetical protein
MSTALPAWLRASVIPRRCRGSTPPGGFPPRPAVFVR